MFRFLIATLLSTVFLVISSYATTLYVSSRGKDANPGTVNKPLASLSGARNRVRELKTAGLQESIVIYFESGSYYLQDPIIFSNQDGGSDKQTITYKGLGAQKPVFNGSKRVTGFKKTADGLWSVYLPEVKNGSWYFEDLFINGKRATRAKWPNEGYFHPVQVSEKVSQKGTGPVPDIAEQTITVSSEAAALLSTVPAKQLSQVLLSINHKWDNTKRWVQSFKPATRQLTIIGSGMIPWNAFDSMSTFTIENAKAALDTPGEWFLDRESGYLYYYPQSTDNLATVYSVVPVTKQFLRIEGTPAARVQNLRFENLSFQYTSFNTPSWAGLEAGQAVTIDGIATIDFANKVVFQNCEFAHTGIYGIWFRKDCQNDSILHCHLWDIGAGGIKLGEIYHDPATKNSSAIVVDNNIIHQGGQVLPCGVGILLFTASDCRITHNEVADFKYSGISAGWVWGPGNSYSKRNTISYNHVHHIGWGMLSDMGGIYTLGGAEGTVISNNIVHHVYSYDYGGWGIYNDEGAADMLIQKNLVYNCKSAAYHDHLGKRNSVINNLFFNQMVQQLETSSGAATEGLIFKHNIVYFSYGKMSNLFWNMNKSISDSNAYWDSRRQPLLFGEKTFEQWQASGQDVHSLIEDPLLLKLAKNNFTIGNQSLLRKIGYQNFDYQSAGVYGNTAWKQTALLSAVTVTKFNRLFTNLAQ